jgi:hypothetical protein
VQKCIASESALNKLSLFHGLLSLVKDLYLPLRNVWNLAVFFVASGHQAARFFRSGHYFYFRNGNYTIVVFVK